MIILLSSGIGFLLASGAAYLLEYLDDTFRSTEDISKVIQSPVIGMIPYTKMWKGNKTYIADQPGSAEAEAFRLLRTNIEFFGIDHDLTTILVTSPDTGDGKTSVAINLAITMAQAGKRVILMDADMRKPNIHKIFEITDAKGLSDLFVNDLELEIIITTWEAGEIVGIITAGKSPPNPAELLASKRMDQILSALKEKADVIIIDSPPLFITDGIILSKKVDGVLVVLRHGFTRKNTVIAAFEQLQRAQARTLGIVFNKIPRMMDGYDAGYRYYSKYYLSRNGKGSSKLKKKTGAKKRSGLLGKMKETLNDTSINPSQEI